MSNILNKYISQLQMESSIDTPSTSSTTNNSSKIIEKLFTFRQQLHVYHWQTNSYSRHIASDGLLGLLTIFIDSFMEKYFGKYGKVNFSKNINISIGNMSNDEALKALDEMINYFNNELRNSLNPKTDTDLSNLIDDLIGNINQTKYLYTLN